MENLGSGRVIVGPGGLRPQAVVLVLALPAAALLRVLAFRFPDVVESVYSRGLYPWVAGTLGAISGLAPVPLAEVLAPPIVLGSVWAVVRRARRAPSGPRRKRRVLARLALLSWGAAGVLAWLFLLVWGLNYARPPLQQRLALDVAGIDAAEVLALGRRLGAEAREVRAGIAPRAGEAPAGEPAPLQLPYTFAELDAELDRALLRLDLPGDRLGRSPAPAKPLLSSSLFAHLGISGIYLPFTAEPSVNRLVPDPSLPVVIAHEKAHQRGITDEGEANLVGVLACLAADDPHARYAGLLDASARLIGAAGVYLPDEAGKAWSVLGPGAIADLRAIRDFWESYRGAATEVAGRVNDAYLRSNRVPGGIESYGRVVQLLVGAERRGLIARPAAGHD